ncbi:hypothetical protein TBR22_A08550 [Luteitalea sp. TBR-22]|uniref:hypothetical protein n=1 Tax=Luteitalea sp. TBR-22 TaxID=2802971 RepID=UPI001AF4E459|nr:hypothetical protein [Luteitalea sp. TBR-22]BCS31652.1 hypothetical protein TBR22_A08550 [Luteitalea sp. TBR-22]
MSREPAVTYASQRLAWPQRPNLQCFGRIYPFGQFDRSGTGVQARRIRGASALVRGSAAQTFTVAGHSQFNVDVRAAFPDAADRRFGAIIESLGDTPAQVVERAMYWDAAGQRWAAGTNALATRLP